jgi:hypothetical protein
MTNSITRCIFLLIISVALASCGSLRTFHDYARAGDTIAIPIGMQPDFSKDNITITITPSTGPQVVINANDPAIRSVINFYPDPVSNMIVSREIDEDTTPFARVYADTTGFMANDDKDWYQTTIFLDLPGSLPIGLTQIDVSNGSITDSTTLNVIGGTGTANTFSADFGTGLLLDENMLDSLSRSSHSTVHISSSTIPSAMEITFTHDPDITIGGTGRAFVVNPLGYRKNLHWSDDGINMKIILIESKDGIIDDMNDYKFYIAGTVSNLQQGTVEGYDINGNVVPGVTLTLTNNY